MDAGYGNPGWRRINKVNDYHSCYVFRTPPLLRKLRRARARNPAPCRVKTNTP